MKKSINAKRNRIYRVGLVGFGNINRAFVRHYMEVKKNISAKYKIELVFNAICDSRYFNYSKNLDIIELIKLKEQGKPLRPDGKTPLDSIKHLIEAGKLDVIIESLPTSKINAGPAYPLLVAALKNRTSVICVDKAPVVFKGEELFKLAAQTNAYVGISGTTAGALPTSGILMNDLKGSEINGLRAILNGTSNYVLDCLMYKKMNLYEAVRQTVNAGIAEPDYRFDLEGTDTSFKMIILGLLITGKGLHPRKVSCKGIMNLNSDEIDQIVKKGRAVRLIGNLVVEKNQPRIAVAPEILEISDPLYGVRGTNKAITYYTRYMGEITILGGASGRMQTSATILKDILNIPK
jgi:homoserine dehydrogenase